MDESDKDRQLQRAFGASIALHAAAVALVGWLPGALGASPGEFSEIRVFDSMAPVLVSPVELVAWPAEAPAEPPVVLENVTPPQPPGTGPARSEPEPARLAPALPRETAPPPRPAPEPSTPEPEVMEPSDELVSPPPEVEAVEVEPEDPLPEPVPTAEPLRPGDPGGGGGGGGGFVDLGSPSPNGDIPVPDTGETASGDIPGEGAGSGEGVGEGTGGGSGGGSGGGLGTGEGTGIGEGSGSGSGGGEGDGGGSTGFRSRAADRRQPRVTRKGSLEYPPSAIADGAEGTVKLKVLVTEKGDVADVTVVESSRDRRLDAAAREFVKGWKYLPAVQDGSPRRVYTYARVEFELR